MDQTYFVVLSYTLSGLVIGGLALWIFISAKAAQTKVKRLDNTALEKPIEH